MGRLDEAREIVEQLRAMTSVVMPDASLYLRTAEHRELLAKGHAAGDRRDDLIRILKTVRNKG